MNEWIAIGELSQLPVGGARVLATAEGDVALFRTRDDSVFALRDHCPHLGGPLSEGIVYGDTVACPLHNWRIDLGSGEALAPDKGCAGHYPVRVEAGVVYLQLSVVDIRAV